MAVHQATPLGSPHVTLATTPAGSPQPPGMPRPRPRPLPHAPPPRPCQALQAQRGGRQRNAVTTATRGGAGRPETPRLPPVQMAGAVSDSSNSGSGDVITRPARPRSLSRPEPLELGRDGGRRPRMRAGSACGNQRKMSAQGDCEFLVKRARELVQGDLWAAKAWLITARSLYPADFNIQVGAAATAPAPRTFSRPASRQPLAPPLPRGGQGSDAGSGASAEAGRRQGRGRGRCLCKAGGWTWGEWEDAGEVQCAGKGGGRPRVKWLLGLLEVMSGLPAQLY